MAWAPEAGAGAGPDAEGWTPETAAARDALLARIHSAVTLDRETPNATPVVLIDGPSGAGKSSLADLLAARWPAAAQPRILRMDDLYPGWDGLDAASRALGADLLEPLVRSGRGRWRRWDWTAERPAEWQELGGADPLIVEGCGALARANLRWARLALWLDADTTLRKARALERDGDLFARHWDRWQGQFERYLAREDPRTNAHLRLDVTDWPIGTPRRRASGTTVVP